MCVCVCVFDTSARRRDYSKKKKEEEVEEDDIENMARRMHPHAVSVLKHLQLEDGWQVVPLEEGAALNRGLHPAPTDAEFAKLPKGASGQALTRGRPYADVIIGDLEPGTFHRFRVRYANNRNFSKWSDVTEPCEVFADWPDVIEKPPVVISRSPFGLYLNWLEPEVIPFCFPNSCRGFLRHDTVWVCARL